MKKSVLTRNFIISTDLINYLALLEVKAAKIGIVYDKERLEKLFIKLGRLKDTKPLFYLEVLNAMVRVDEDFVLRNSYVILEMIILDEKKYDIDSTNISCEYLNRICDIEKRGKEIISEYCNEKLRGVIIPNILEVAKTVRKDANLKEYVYIELLKEFNNNYSTCSYFISEFANNSNEYAYDYILEKRQSAIKAEKKDLDAIISKGAGRIRKVQTKNGFLHINEQ